MKYLVVFLCYCISLCTYGQDWNGSFDEALSNAKRLDKPIVLIFSGSDWCGPCISLDKRIWQSKEFQNYAREHYVLYKADFPRKKNNALEESKVRENKALAEKFNPKGYFPLVVILNKNQNVLGTTGFKKGTPANYIAHLNSLIK